MTASQSGLHVLVRFAQPVMGVPPGAGAANSLGHRTVPLRCLGAFVDEELMLGVPGREGGHPLGRCFLGADIREF